MQFDLGITRNGLKDVKNRMAQGTLTSLSPRELLRHYSDMADGLVRKAFQKAQSSVPSPSICLMAVGGYGRTELAPYSDVDLLLLHSPADQSDLSPLVEKILYPLWDLGLEVSCSSRSNAECLKMAQSDLQIKTSLIDGRYLDGEYEFFRNLYDLFSKKILHRKVRRFAGSLAQDLYLRHRKYEDPAYVLEPNIKEGDGGLRDFQIGRWVVRAKYKTDRWESILFPDHSRILDKSLQFLWAVRNQLHLLSGRRQDDLTFEWQEKIAPILGFSQGARGIEEMMRQYHLSAQKISNFAWDILERVLYQPSSLKKTFLFFQKKKIDPNFGLARGELTLLDPMTFKREPAQLMTLFQHCQDTHGKMDFRTEEAVMEALPFIDDRFRHRDGVNQTFLSILRRGESMTSILKKMHELGFLSCYIPEFSEIEGKVHYDLYHVHPIDIHSLLAVEELEKVGRGVYQKDYALLTSLIQELEKPEILLLTALLHDIGKGTEGDHSVIGAEIVRQIARRMGLPKEDRDLMGFLVSHHLFMLETAFRRDLHDEQTVFNFANTVKNLTQLRMLYLLTFADVRAVGPEAWTSWKDSLLTELFLKTSRLFETRENTQVSQKRFETIKRLTEYLHLKKIPEYTEHLPARYLSCYGWGEIAHHIEMALSLEQEPLFVRWTLESGRLAKVILCTKDSYGLFSKIAGSMFLNRLNILEAQIHTWGNGVALDTFYVEDVTEEVERRLHHFKRDVDEILNGKSTMKELFSKKGESKPNQQKIIPGVVAEIKVNNRDSDFYTIIEITGEDRLGILYEITQALTDHGCNISFARISTLGNRIVDVFYVQNEWGEKIVEKQKMENLRESLFRRLVSRETVDSSPLSSQSSSFPMITPKSRI
jgi:[protein-PII] uridylyltransferase